MEGISNLKLWYISFCDEHFLGGMHIWAPSFPAAVYMAYVIGQNPGGEAFGVEVPSPVAGRIRECWIDRLLTKEELATVTREMFPDDPTLLRVDSQGNVLEENV